MMVMNQPRKYAANHLVAKVIRPIESGDTARQLLRDAEMARFQVTSSPRLSRPVVTPAIARSPVAVVDATCASTFRAKSKQTAGGAAMSVSIRMMAILGGGLDRVSHSVF